eukprot:Trichotokara_eunicae@DN1207_c0_g1_i2.p1
MVSRADAGPISVDHLHFEGCGSRLCMKGPESKVWVWHEWKDVLETYLETSKGFSLIEIIRDATVLTVILNDGEMVYSIPATEHIGECEFRIELPPGFGPFEVSFFDELPQMEEPAPEQTATVAPPSISRTIELPSKTRTERQCRPKARHSLRRLLDEAC